MQLNYVKIPNFPKNKIFLDEEIFTNNQTFDNLLKKEFSSVEQILEELSQLRGGEDNIDYRRLIIKYMIIGYLVRIMPKTYAFAQHPIDEKTLAPRIALFVNNYWHLRNNARLFSQNHDGAGLFVKQQKRNQPNPKDFFIAEENVVIRHEQAQFKLHKHGSAFGIDSHLNNKKQSVCHRTPENVESFKEAIKALVLNGKRIEGSFRGREEDGYPAIHFYDEVTKLNVIFKKSTREFVSGWILTTDQAEDLLKNANVGGRL